MSDVLLNNTPRGRVRRGPGAALLAATAAVVLMSGCANHHSITVGSIPDDYRTNHPIVVSEQDKTIDIPVGVSDRGLSRMQRVAVDGFIADYDRSAAPLVTIMTPYGSANQHAAARVSADMVTRLRKGGVPEGRILHESYEAAQYGDAAPIRLVYSEMKASTGQCGRWPEDLAETSDNRHWTNFGCSYQNNLAAQIANPADLLGPRKPSEIDTARRSVSIDDYRDRFSGWDSEVNY